MKKCWVIGDILVLHSVFFLMWDALPIDQSTSACTGKPVVLKLE